MVWIAGTRSMQKTMDVLKVFIEQKIAAAPYKSRLPKKQFYIVFKDAPGKREVGVKVAIHVAADDAPPHIYNAGDGNIIEESLRIMLDVRSDDKSGGIEASEALYNVLKSIFANPIHIQELIALGIYNVRENIDTSVFGDTEFVRPLGLSCTTTVYL